MWVYSPSKPKPPKVPEAFKKEVEAKAQEVVDKVLKPHCLKPPPPDPQLNYIVDIYVKWYRSYFYFCAKYACPGPNALSPFFEVKNARMEYVGGRSFNLAYLRHTGEWNELEQGLSLEKCLAQITPNSHYFIC